MEQIEIRLLGSFKVTVDGRDISTELSASKKGISLLQMLILHRGRPVNNRYIYETLWAGSQTRKPELALKTLISRFRQDMSAYSVTLGACIKTMRESYAFDTDLSIDVDLFQVFRLLDRLESKSIPDEERMELCDALFRLYEGDLLADRNGSEIWAQSQQQELHYAVFTQLQHYVTMLIDFQHYEEADSICSRLLEINNFDERLHMAKIDALVHLRRVKEAMEHYRRITELYHKYLGIRVPDSIQSYYTNIINANNTMDDGLAAICNDIRQTEKLTGALVCEYGLFREIYKLQVRAAGREEFTTYVVLVMMQCIDKQPLDLNRLDQLMKGLETIMVNSLRKSDIVCRYSPDKYALLLPVKEAQNCDRVMDRIKVEFYKQYGRSRVVLNYRYERVNYIEALLKETSE